MFYKFIDLFKNKNIFDSFLTILKHIREHVTKTICNILSVDDAGFEPATSSV